MNVQKFSTLRVNSLAGCEGDTKVILLERRDGLPSMVNTARKLATAVRHKHTALQDINPSSVDALIQGKEMHELNETNIFQRVFHVKS